MTSRLPSNLTYFQETTNSNRDITETYSISQVFHILLIATPNKLSRLQGQTHRDELGDLVLLINKKQWEVNWKLASGHKKEKRRLNHGSFCSSGAQWYVKRQRGEMRRKQGTQPEMELASFSVFSGPVCEGCVQGYRSGPGHQRCQWELQNRQSV